MAVDTNAALGAMEHGNHTAFEEVKAQSDSAASQVTGINPDNYDQFGSHTMNQYEDFAGFDESHRGDFNDAVTRYISDANDILNGFDAKSESMATAFKGEVANSLQSFFEAIKVACKSYVDAISEEKTKVYEAEQNWLRATQSISGNIDEDSSVVKPVVINN
jgi:hypothetical protein